MMALKKFTVTCAKKSNERQHQGYEFSTGDAESVGDFCLYRVSFNSHYAAYTTVQDLALARYLLAYM